MKKLILLVALLTMVAFVSGVMAQGTKAPAPLRQSPLAQQHLLLHRLPQRLTGA